MEFSEMERRLKLVKLIVTPDHEEPNDIVDVDAESVTVKSHDTGVERRITFAQLKGRGNTHSCIKNALRQILGLPQVKKTRPASKSARTSPAQLR
jgi:hypothetical protein